MSLRKPPALANWLLDRAGFARQNPPLAGDLLEEFRSGRSAAWYWRQTVAVIAAGTVRNARLCRRPLTAFSIGWAAETSVTFVLWWFHYPPQLPHIVGSIAHVLAWIGGVWFLWKLFRPGRPARGGAPPNPSDTAPSPVALACSTFIVFVMSYCAFALLWDVPLWALIFIQAGWLVVGAKNFLTSSEPNCL
jgi:hypothetical protein